MNTKNESEPSTRQTRRAARRKTEILEAAAAVFAEKGFHRTTTKDIAEAADVAEGTIYNYFESKDELLFSLIDWIADLGARRESYAKSLDVDFHQALHDLMLERFTAIKEQNTLFLAILPELFITPHLRELYAQRVMNPSMHDLEEHFRARIERHQIENVDVPMRVRFLSALGLGLELLMLLGDKEVQSIWDDTPRMVESLIDVILHGILPAPSRPPANPSNE